MRSISRINASTIASRWKNASIIGNMWPSTGQVTLNVSSLPMPATLGRPSVFTYCSMRRFMSGLAIGTRPRPRARGLVTREGWQGETPAVSTMSR